MSARRPVVALIEALDSRVLLSTTTTTTTSSLAGLWQGTRTEAGLGGTFATVAIDLNLSQKGQLITGTEHRSSPLDSEYFADLRMHGTLRGQTFDLQDDFVTAEDRPKNYKWLLYKATLQLSADGQMMTGAWKSGRFHGTMTFKRLPLPRLVLNSATTRDHQSVTIDYTIALAKIDQPLRFGVYRSKTNRLTSTSKLLGFQTLTPATRARDLTLGEHRVRLLSGTSLVANPRFPYVIVVAEGFKEASGSINAARLRLS